MYLINFNNNKGSSFSFDNFQRNSLPYNFQDPDNSLYTDPIPFFYPGLYEPLPS